MSHPLLDLEALDGDVCEYLDRVGERFAMFDQQGSGCHAAGVSIGSERWFVKFSVEPRAIASLERARALHRRVAHPAIVGLRHGFSTHDGLALVYPWVDGEVLYRPPGGRAWRLDPRGPHARFRSLAIEVVLDALDSIFDAHFAVAAGGFVAVDFYDGCVIYDFQAGAARLIDLDEYRPGPFVVDADRLPGSRRFMAPEEFSRGATVDERTTVFNLGRAAQVLLDKGDLDDRFRAGPELAAVARRATCERPADRHDSVAAFVTAWRAAQLDALDRRPGG